MQGYPFALIAFTLDELTKEGSNKSGYMLDKAYEQFALFDPELKTGSGEQQFFMLNQVWVNWSNIKPNLITYAQCETTWDFKHVAFNCKYAARKELLVYSEEYSIESKVLGYMK